VLVRIALIAIRHFAKPPGRYRQAADSAAHWGSEKDRALLTTIAKFERKNDK
jgi:hypothetical protein